MNDRPKSNMDDENIAKGIRDLPSVEADAVFRSRLRSEFVSGAMGSDAGPVVDVSPERVRPPARRRWLWLVPVAAAAAVAVVMMLNPGPRLRVLETAGDGYVRIGKTPVQLSDRVRINDDLAPGMELSLPPNATLDLIADGVVMYEVVGGTRMTVPGTPGRWFKREVAFTLTAGEVRMKTGRATPAAPCASPLPTVSSS